MKSRFKAYSTSHLPLICGSITLLLLIASVPAVGQLNFIFKAHGVFGSASGCTADDCIFVQVGTNKTSNTAVLEYSVHNISTGHEFNGFGQIPMSAIRGNGTTALAVDVDTSNIPGYSNVFCTGVPPCDPAPGGLVSVSWQKTNTSAQSQAGISTSTFFRVKNQFSGRGQNVSASAIGSVLGTSLPPDPSGLAGMIGTVQQTIITVTFH